RVLAQLDVIYLPVATSIPFTEEQRKLLMRLVDSGVLLWVDGRPGGAFQSRLNPFFMPLDFTNSVPPGQVFQHPLLDGLFHISAPAVRRARRGTPWDRAARTEYAGVPLSRVIGAQGTPGAAVAAGRYGNGFVVADSIDIGGSISRAIPPAAAQVVNNADLSG